MKGLETCGVNALRNWILFEIAGIRVNRLPVSGALLYYYIFAANSDFRNLQHFYTVIIAQALFVTYGYITVFHITL